MGHYMYYQLYHQAQLASADCQWQPHRHHGPDTTHQTHQQRHKLPIPTNSPTISYPSSLCHDNQQSTRPNTATHGIVSTKTSVLSWTTICGIIQSAQQRQSMDLCTMWSMANMKSSKSLHKDLSIFKCNVHVNKLVLDPIH